MKQKVFLFSEGNKDMKTLLGGKGANLCEMTNLKLPIPQGFIISTEICKEYLKKQKKLSNSLLNEINLNIRKLEELTGKTLGGNNPLILSIRSGAPISMPGMMDTILNLGLNDDVVEILSIKYTREFAFSIYSRFIEMFSNIVKQIPREKFTEIEHKLKHNKIAEKNKFYEILTEKYKSLYKKNFQEDFPQNPEEQLIQCILAIFNSWNNNRAKLYRKLNNIDDNMGTAVNIQEMVFGNLNNVSATGVAFTRNPANGENKIFGEFLINAQGEDIVAGIRTPEEIKNMKNIFPKLYSEFINYATILENHYKDMQDIEFTIENEKLFILQTRNGKRSPYAAIKIATDMVKENLISKEQALLRINPKDITILLHGSFNKDSIEKAQILGKGLGGSAGIAVGKIVLRSEDVVDSDTILVRTETSPEDLNGMSIASGILTAKGGLTSHGAVVARSMGKCCVAGCPTLSINLERNEIFLGNNLLKEGDYISIDGYSGNIYLGKLKIDLSEEMKEFYEIIDWAKSIKKLSVRMNADTPEDCIRGLKYFAEGVGLCRTEHMFFKADRIEPVREMILANTSEERRNALNKIKPYQKDDFLQIFKIIKDKPINIRLLDPPLHEFLPNTPKELQKLSKSMKISLAQIKERLQKLEEHNPMLGHRGCRLAITYPEIYITQCEAIIESALEVLKENITVNLEIMIPLISSLEEFNFIKTIIETNLKEKYKEDLNKITYSLGTMIELPRACITANKIAQSAAFFSFGTNDLTQTTFGMSRDDSGKFIEEYKEHNILNKSPFETIDIDGVGYLMKLAINLARETNPNFKIGICGEQGGDPESIDYCHKLNLDYISCSGFKIPIAIIAAAQSQLKK
ncbi:MAG: pyruvate, phosphate dikinase [Cetobacterium sp.]|uniref:pyruvate, phosphate dikinase n=1 Tax=Cetobacterium sp. TaxID=2071632 RepID=UPI003F3358B1